MSDNTLSIYTIYQNPSDFPGKFVVRQSLITENGINLVDPPVSITETLEEARQTIPEGLTLIPRLPYDLPVIVECWI